MAVKWTPEIIELVTTLWMRGHSASQIAAMVRGATRSAIIGKVHRMGLSRSYTTPRLYTAPANTSLGIVRQKPSKPGEKRVAAPRKPKGTTGRKVSVWTPENVERLMALHNDGYGPTRIAATMRLRYAQVRTWMRRNGVKPVDESGGKRTRDPNGTTAPKIPVTVSPVNAPPGARLWTSRAFGECARPVAGEGADTYSCAMPVAPGRQYCLACCALMFVPTVPAPVSKMWGARA